MTVSTEQITLQVTFPKEKLEALRFYMNEKDLTVEGELQIYMTNIYDKYIPTATRRYLDRNDNEEETQAEVAVVSNEVTPETTRSTSTRGRKKSKKTEETETINMEDQEVTQESSEQENQGMEMSM